MISRVMLRDALLDAWQLSLAPGLPAYLPWPQTWACYRRLAAYPWLFAESTAAAAVAAEVLPINDMAAFQRDVRTTWLLDAADLYLSRRHALDWWPEHISVEGAWPCARAFVVVTSHYGTGLWLLRALRRAGHRHRFLSGRFERADFGHRGGLYRYGARRLAEVERIGGAPIAYRPGVRQALHDTLARGVSVVGLIDLPPRLAPRGQHPVTLLDRPVSLPDGLLNLAHDAGVPIVPCWVTLDYTTGHRHAVIGEALSPQPVGHVLNELAAILSRLIREQPAAWMFWQEWRDWQRDAAALLAPETCAESG
jgi:hypothetical protein